MKNSFRLLFTLLLLPFLGLYGDELFNPSILYLTWQHSPNTTMTIQWISSIEDINDQIEFRQDGAVDWQNVEGYHLQLPDHIPFLLHRIELINLAPGASYQFKFGSNAKTFRFRTIPSHLDSPVQFVVGGDIYHDGLSVVTEMNKLAAAQSPHFVLLGGDISYSAKRGNFFQNFFPKKEKYERWLAWLKTWTEQMITPEGYLIPILPVIGNHDVVGGYRQSPYHARFFYTLFIPPRHTSYNVWDFGNYMSIIGLDSGHTNTIWGKQAEWLQNCLMLRRNVKHKFAFYHVGAYPSVRSDKSEESLAIKRYWVPFFEKYGINTAFEHHDHAYKRTHPIRENKIDPEGILYLGDGAWGIEQPRTPYTPDQRWYLAKTSASRHLIVVSVDHSTRRYKAINQFGDMIDSYTHHLNGVPSYVTVH